MYHSFSRKDSLQDAARSILEASKQTKHPLDESIQRGDNVHIKSTGKMGVVLAVVGDRLTVKRPGEEEAQILSVDEVELFQDYDESTELEEPTKKLLSDLSDDEKARIEDILTRRDKNMPAGMRNRMNRPILMFDKDDQYHGSYADEAAAKEKIKRVGDTEGWINGPWFVEIDEAAGSHSLHDDPLVKKVFAAPEGKERDEALATLKKIRGQYTYNRVVRSLKALNQQHGVKESTELTELKEPYAVVDTADDDRVLGTYSHEKNALRAIKSAHLPPMSVKDKTKLKVVKLKKKQHLGWPLKEESSEPEDADLKNMSNEEINDLLDDLRQQMDRAEAALTDFDEGVSVQESYKKGEKVKILLNPEDEHDTGEDNPDAKWGEGEIVDSWGHDEYDVKLLSGDSFAGHYKKGDIIPQIYGAQLRLLDENEESMQEDWGSGTDSIHDLLIGTDMKGNRVLKVAFPDYNFTIQTNGNLPITHSKGVNSETIKELIAYMKEVGKPKHKEVLKKYFGIGEGVSVQKMLDAEKRETGKFYSMSDMTLAFDENPEGSTSQLGDGVMELDGFNAAGWQYLDGKYAVRVGGGYMIYTDLEAAKAYAKDDWS